MAIQESSDSVRLANRAAALSFAAAFAVIAALAAFPKVLDGSSPAITRPLAGVPVVAAVILVALAVRARMRWGAHCRQLPSDAAPQQPQGGSRSAHGIRSASGSRRR